MSDLPTGVSCATRCLLTLAKSEDEKQALGNCFDLFFSQPEVKDDSRAGG